MRILIADEDAVSRELLISWLSDDGHICHSADAGYSALELTEQHQFDLALVSTNLPEIDCITFTRIIYRRMYFTEVIALAHYGSIPLAIDALKSGAYSYVRKPIDLADLKHTISRADELIRLRQTLARHTREKLARFQVGNFIAVGSLMLRIKEQLTQLSAGTGNVLITGAAGTGKNHTARIIHYAGHNPQSHLIQLSPIDFTDWKASSELIHPSGIRLTWNSKASDLVAQGCSTVVLQSPDELDADQQSQLAALIKEWTNESQSISDKNFVRIIAMVNSASAAAVYKGILTTELSDCFQYHIHLPNLNARREEIPLYIKQFIERLRRQWGLKRLMISQPVQEFLHIYDWPGNLSQMKRLIEELAATAVNGVISISDLRRAFHDENLFPSTKSSQVLSLGERQTIQKLFQERAKKWEKDKPE